MQLVKINSICEEEEYSLVFGKLLDKEQNLVSFSKCVYPSEEISHKSVDTHRKKYQMPTLVECCDELYLAI